MKERVKDLWEKVVELKKEYETFVKEELKDIPELVIPWLKGGEVGRLDFGRFPKGYYTDDSWEGTIVRGEFLVLRDGELVEVKFENNYIEYSENETPSGEEDVWWWENLKEGDVILAVYIREIERDNCHYKEDIKVILLEKPYIYMKSKFRPEEAMEVKKKFEEWLETMMGNVKRELGLHKKLEEE